MQNFRCFLSVIHFSGNQFKISQVYLSGCNPKPSLLVLFRIKRIFLTVLTFVILKSLSVFYR